MLIAFGSKHELHICIQFRTAMVDVWEARPLQWRLHNWPAITTTNKFHSIKSRQDMARPWSSQSLHIVTVLHYYSIALVIVLVFYPNNWVLSHRIISIDFLPTPSFHPWVPRDRQLISFVTTYPCCQVKSRLTTMCFTSILSLKKENHIILISKKVLISFTVYGYNPSLKLSKLNIYLF